MFTPAALIEAVLLAATCSVDAFSASLAYGVNNIRIPMLSVQIINLICSSVIGLSLIAGAVVRQYLPDWLTVALCFTILFSIGMSKLLDSVVKSLIKKYNGLNKKVSFSLFSLRCILNVYADPQMADADGSRVISPTEAAMLALSLSLDGMALGFGAAVGNINPLAVFAASLICGLIAILAGCHLGTTLVRKLPFNISWLSGVVLIAMAFMKL